ncbi:MAG: outer membrane beta-barrel protein [Prevotella sp.]|nr:outer membrane beta-barrel protein [Prevotella sp.]
MRKMLTIGLLMAAVTALHAQDENEYRMEIGAGAAVVSYEGDLNGSIVKNMQPMGTVLWRFNISPHMGLKANVSYGKLKGDSRDVTTYYPDLQASPVSFSHSLIDVGVTYEYNFWPYGTGRDYRGAKRCTPFVFGGVGATHVSGGPEKVFTANIPLGVGVKYKLADRLNLGIEWAAHFTLSDKLDGIVDPYGVKSTGIFKNKDAYSALQVTLTYSFMARCRTCHNADE